MTVREPRGETLRHEPGSFRDPTSQVYYDLDGRVLRAIRGDGVADWQAVRQTDFLSRLMGEGKICATEQLTEDGQPTQDGAEVLLRHDRVPFISYPYEWTYSMLRDAVLLHLEVLQAALAEQMTTKDGSAYNVQFRGPAATFIDLGSFTPLRDGEPWAGYRQFCQTMLYPLLLTAHLGVPFQPWLRAQLEGIEAAQLRPLFRGLRRWRAGVLRHLFLHDAMQRRFGSASAGQVREELAAAGFSQELVVALVRGLHKLVRGLDREPPGSHWRGYRQGCSYTDADQAAKHAFVANALAAAPGITSGIVLDLGTNDGEYARLAAQHARTVLAVESDHAVLDALYRSVRDQGEQRIQPLLLDLADPSPARGWRGRERASFAGRAGPDKVAVVLALALVHHLAIGRNVPLPEVLDQLAELGHTLVVEFVEPDDPMARQLLANKPAGMFGDYRRDVFERLLADRLTIAHREELPSGTRTLYAAVPRG